MSPALGHHIIAIGAQFLGELVEAGRTDISQHQIVLRAHKASAGAPHAASGSGDQDFAAGLNGHQGLSSGVILVGPSIAARHAEIQPCPH